MYSDKYQVLQQKIIEGLERKYDYLRGLKGLKTQNIKLANISAANKKNNLNTSQYTKITPTLGSANEYQVNSFFKQNDHILCDMTSLDLWV